MQQLSKKRFSKKFSHLRAISRCSRTEAVTETCSIKKVNQIFRKIHRKTPRPLLKLSSCQRGDTTFANELSNLDVLFIYF